MPLWLKILCCILVAELLGGLGGYVTATSIGDWYASLQRPPGTPPNTVFGPVWSLLYAAMASAFALVWHRAPTSPSKRRAQSLFAVQLLLNLAWTPVFFGLHAITAALGILVALVVVLILTLRAYSKLDRLAAGLLVPYLAWVVYASYLNAGFLWFNR